MTGPITTDGHRRFLTKVPKSKQRQSSKHQRNQQRQRTVCQPELMNHFVAVCPECLGHCWRLFRRRSRHVDQQLHSVSSETRVVSNSRASKTSDLPVWRIYRPRYFRSPSADWPVNFSDLSRHPTERLDVDRWLDHINSTEWFVQRFLRCSRDKSVRREVRSFVYRWNSPGDSKDE